MSTENPKKKPGRSNDISNGSTRSYIELYERGRLEETIEECRLRIIDDILERNKCGRMLLSDQEIDMLKNERVLPSNVLDRLKKTLDLKVTRTLG